MSHPPAEIVCCGHVCLDVIPAMRGGDLPPAGGLAEVGPAALATGGSVSNTGLALHRLGLGVRLVGRVGRDLFGDEVRRRYAAAGPGLSDHLQTVDDQPTSYTVVISPPGGDRRFLHCPGVNATFTDVDVDALALHGARHLHFGYPPAMRAVCADDGAALSRLLQRAKAAGLTTSLDMCGVDPGGGAGAVDWPALLRRVLPDVDVFMPSADELHAMAPGVAASEVLGWGCRALVVKDGTRGLTIETTAAAESLGAGWGGRRLRSPTFEVPVVGTTGAGDVTIAGFLAGMLRGASLDHAADLACAAGAHCVQTADATSGLCSLDRLRAFLKTDPPRRQP